MDKQQQILEKAVELFGEKGYENTSIQEIADEIGIAKGSIYSYFQSKEDLLISIYEHYQQLVFERAFVVSLHRNIPVKQRLMKQFEVQFEGIAEYKFFMKMQMRGDGPKHSEKLKQFEYRMRGRFFTWLDANIIELFGPDITPYKWDLFWMIQSIYTSYMKLFVSDYTTIQSKDLATHIVTQLQHLGESYLHGDSQPLLKEEEMAFFAVQMDKQGAFVSFEKREQAWKDIYETIELCDTIQESQRKELIECVDRISIEVNKQQPEQIILKGLFSILKSEPLLKKSADQLEDILLTE
ncbi:TetR/AcrR family transcriptional regulator [Alkalihalobacterium bogoriense]|uniref:TetR/AcrR family transcriptional regulator n=1 Tax=Alkalihalobacterium bogoriense TaxID=246272 RepID=UPI00047E5F9B|nr:TetR/AcrR family transcriptional regulator [Alkalihalobacterium bogoriense]